LPRLSKSPVCGEITADRENHDPCSCSTPLAKVGRYISLERIIEGTKETYYEGLLRSGQRWDTGHHDLTPWHQYSLGVLIYAYREFEQWVGELVTAPGAKSQMVRSAIDTFVSGHTFSSSELERLCPTVSRARSRLRSSPC